MSKILIQKKITRKRRKARTRAKIHGTAKRPRLALSRSLKHIYVQIIDDDAGNTIASASDQKLSKDKQSGKKEDIARDVGKLIAEHAKSKKITEVVFDKSGVKYHGRVKAVAEGAREGGLKF
ncbi:50S ribosomal protein L18 [Patescibacteria group bacterium]|nr:50S ribosomal protein L18 [Patescibacteria group bacterium]MBU1075336.1 50S ribosomal protein L18 [Patescibacteria group bacterium]MBU1951412.1 50S ribosomal protein L18 [Patescibacteria group bacterium]MBU2229291.1 50S ribosomal protein L18 [Patescibacteria group bacterium]